MSLRFRNLLLVFAATAVSFTAGCSEAGTPVDASPSRPVRGATTTASSDFTATGNLEILARFRVKPQITIAWAKTWIGPAGGRLDFQGFSIVVPPGAVNKVTQFSIRLPVDPNGSERVVAEFAPHNVAFEVPVTIGFPYRGTTIEGSASAHVVWWNDGWVDMGGTVSADGSQIFTQTPHFSQYGTTDERGGSISVSGG
ncbi:MAG TPA: hypothetical protein VF541_20855 [Longimicrobium sp.]|jgi:hypothetical protein